MSLFLEKKSFNKKLLFFFLKKTKLNNLNLDLFKLTILSIYCNSKA